MSRTLTGWSFWGTRGSRGTEAPARQPGTRVNPLQRAGPIRVRAEIPSVTRKRAFLNHAPMTPYELASSPVHLGDLSVLFLSAGGGNPDILGCFDAVAERAPRRLCLLCTRTRTPLAARAAAVSGASLHEFDLPTIKDGFLATNSLLATSVLLARAFQYAPPGRDPLPHHLEDLIHPGQSSEEFQSGLARTCRQLWDRATIVVLHGHVTQAAAIDLESKLTEAALGQVQLADYRNFAHGRHHWFAKHGESSAIISLASQEDLRVAEKTLSLLPKDIPVAKFEVGGGVPGCLQAVALSIHITGQAGKARGIDPGRPSVPAFGRKLYHLNGAYRGKGPTRLPEREMAAIIRKAGIGIATLTAQGNLASWWESYSAFMDELRSAGFRAIVLDYDGTLCDAHERYSGPGEKVTEQLISFLRGGILVGIATGRGKSVRKDLRERIRDPDLSSRLLIGYHNGAEIGFLNDDSQPPLTGQLDESLAAIAFDLRRAAGQSLPKNPNRSTHSRENESAQVIGAFRKPLYGITFLTVQIDTPCQHIDTPCQHGEACRGPCRR